MIFIYTVLLKVSSLINSHEDPFETHTIPKAGVGDAIGKGRWSNIRPFEKSDHLLVELDCTPFSFFATP
jgi:hypothetical protein